MKDGYTEEYQILLVNVEEAKKVLVYVEFLDEYIQVMKGDFMGALKSGQNSGYPMEREIGWQWDKTDSSIFIN